MHPFGCAAFPCLTPFNKQKLQFHSQKCLFVGYSSSHKGFKCISSSRKLYLSRHVVFDHNDFPFSDLFPKSTNSENNSSSVQLTSQLAGHNQNYRDNPTLSPIAVTQSSSDYSRSVVVPSPNSFNDSSTPAFIPHDNPTTPSNSLSNSSTRYLLPTAGQTLPISSDSTAPTQQSSSTRYMLATATSQQQYFSNTVEHLCNLHPMVTRSKVGISKPKKPFAATVSALHLLLSKKHCPIPSSMRP